MLLKHTNFLHWCLETLITWLQALPLRRLDRSQLVFPWKSLLLTGYSWCCRWRCDALSEWLLKLSALCLFPVQLKQRGLLLSTLLWSLTVATVMLSNYLWSCFSVQIFFQNFIFEKGSVASLQVQLIHGLLWYIHLLYNECHFHSPTWHLCHFLEIDHKVPCLNQDLKLS